MPLTGYATVLEVYNALRGSQSLRVLVLCSSRVRHGSASASSLWSPSQTSSSTRTTRLRRRKNRRIRSGERAAVGVLAERVRRMGDVNFYCNLSEPTTPLTHF